MKKYTFIIPIAILCFVALTLTCACNKHEHTIIVDKAISPTCTQAGLTEGSHCDICGEVLTAQQEVPALQHSPIIDDAVMPTCSQTGLTEGCHCQLCGMVFTPQLEIAKLEHTVVIDEAIKPTTHACGYTEGSHCCVCGEIIISQQTIEKLVTITFNANDEFGTLIGETTQSIENGSTTSCVTAIANIGYKFVSWSNASTSRTIAITAYADMELTAIFESEDNPPDNINIYY